MTAFSIDIGLGDRTLDIERRARNVRESVSGAMEVVKRERKHFRSGYEQSRSGAASSGVRRGQGAPKDGTKASERSFSGANWL